MNVASKFLSQINERNRMLESMTDDEKINYIKAKFNLTHGNKKRKRKRKK